MMDIQQKINKLGKYLKKKIDGAYKIAFSPGMCDVYLTVYYQLPGDADSFKTLNFDLNITHYADKIRINVTAMDDMEKTIGQLIYKPDKIEHMDTAVQVIYRDVCKKIAEEYSGFDFIF